jgi:hypothetical protein
MAARMESPITTAAQGRPRLHMLNDVEQLSADYPERLFPPPTKWFICMALACWWTVFSGEQSTIRVQLTRTSNNFLHL